MSAGLCAKHGVERTWKPGGWRRGRARLRRSCSACDKDRARRSQPNKRAWNHRNPDKRRAHKRVEYAVATGKLKKAPCEVCGAEKAHAHHHDYSRPLDVQWLCSLCHQRCHTGPRTPHSSAPADVRSP